MAHIRLAIADDHKIFREGLKALLEDYPQVQVLVEAASGSHLLELLAQHPVDVVLMDINMPELDGLQATALVLERYPHTKVLALSMYDEDKYIVDMMKAGARGYLLKSAEPDEIMAAIAAVHDKGFHFNESLSATLVKQLLGQSPVELKSEATLNQRETEVLQLLCQEYSNVEIADKLFLSVRTVEGYRTRLFEKIGAKNIVGLVIYAVKKGVIQV
ncbi:response regulator transcription factor [Hymenobacter weizhouensis]|uniref:response regulator transcription factor n=1 Tax=Hymenobacter sp. YIM 151500-1 TaxID=2987689 RepID=UPI002225EC1D|nr:response regulator transcription factor [Hymenobacter sp. YIM 151500-1]UYZ62110.1 response regulator transcription factor [Hymenobacter sp. YIM 151500-1]